MSMGPIPPTLHKEKIIQITQLSCDLHTFSDFNGQFTSLLRVKFVNNAYYFVVNFSNGPNTRPPIHILHC